MKITSLLYYFLPHILRQWKRTNFTTRHRPCACLEENATVASREEEKIAQMASTESGYELNRAFMGPTPKSNKCENFFAKKFIRAKVRICGRVVQNPCGRTRKVGRWNFKKIARTKKMRGLNIHY